MRSSPAAAAGSVPGGSIDAAQCAQVVTAMSAAGADDDPRALQIQQDGLQKLPGEIFLGGNILNFDDPDRGLRQHGECLQRVEPSLRNSHGVLSIV